MFTLTPAEMTSSAAVAKRALAEDLDGDGDITTSAVFGGAQPEARAKFVSRSAGILAGTHAATAVFAEADPGLAVTWIRGDGDAVKAGDVLGEVSGDASSVLLAERSALNLLCHLSGIATLTAEYVAAAEAVAPGCVVRDTRKTTPGLRLLEKAATRAGGAVNHRLSLADGALIKDNHLAELARDRQGAKASELAGLLQLAVGRIRNGHPGVEVEIEADSLEEVEAAIAAGADIVLCDNMAPEMLRRAVATVRGRAKVEASGGVTLANVAEIAATGVDYVAIGALTHSAPAMDIGLDVEALGSANLDGR